MQIYWSAVFNFSSLFHYLITQSFVVLSYTVRYMNVLADGFKVASSTLYLGEFHAMQLRDAAMASPKSSRRASKSTLQVSCPSSPITSVKHEGAMA